MTIEKFNILKSGMLECVKDFERLLLEAEHKNEEDTVKIIKKYLNGIIHLKE